jgi:acetyl esterase/lipase
VGEAIGWLSRHLDEYGGDPARLLLIGHSAGAHLVSLASTDPRYVRAYGVNPSRLLGTVSLDTAAFDVRERISQVPGARKDLYYNAFGTPQENAATGSWAAGSPIRFADSGDARHLLVTQASNPRRVAENRRMAAALVQTPQSVFPVPYDHGGINAAVGSSNDPAGETQRIMDFFARRIAAAG